MLIAVAALCLALVTFLLALLSSARVQVDEANNACPNLGLTGWASPNFPVTPQYSIPGMNNNTMSNSTISNNTLSNTTISNNSTIYTYGTVQSPGVTPLGFRIAPDGYKEFALYAQPVQQLLMNLADILKHQAIIPPNNWVDTSGYTTQTVPSSLTNGSVYAWGYNGQVPGPVIEVNIGDNVRIILTNELPEATSLNLQGILHPWEDDGQAGVNEQPVQPQQKRIYQFTVTQCGTFMYHSGFQTWKHDTRGLYGTFVSHCPGAEPTADQDISIVVSEFAMMEDHDSRNCPAWWRTYVNWDLFNGHSSPSIPIIRVNAGNVVRMRFLNPFAEASHPIYIHGHQWTLISSGGSAPLDPSVRTTSSMVTLPAGVAQDVLFTARAGIWAIHCHVNGDIINFLQANTVSPTQLAYPGGMYTLICVTGVTPRGTVISC